MECDFLLSKFPENKKLFSGHSKISFQRIKELFSGHSKQESDHGGAGCLHLGCHKCRHGDHNDNVHDDDGDADDDVHDDHDDDGGGDDDESRYVYHGGCQ